MPIREKNNPSSMPFRYGCPVFGIDRIKPIMRTSENHAFVSAFFHDIRRTLVFMLVILIKLLSILHSSPGIFNVNHLGLMLV